jgi:hypothetical protein
MPRKRKIPVCPGQLSLFDLPIEQFAADIFGAPPPHLETPVSNERQPDFTNRLEPPTWLNWQPETLPRRSMTRPWTTRTSHHRLRVQKLWQTHSQICRTGKHVLPRVNLHSTGKERNTNPIEAASGEKHSP